MYSLPDGILLAISIAIGLVGTLLRADFSKRRSSGIRSYYRFTGVMSVLCALGIWLLDGPEHGFGLPKLSTYSLLLGALFGLVTMIQCLVNIAALRVGPLSYTTVIISLATIIPALSGVIFWDEGLGTLQIIGMVLMVGCFFFSVDNTKTGSEKPVTVKWLILCGIAFCCTGAIGVMQKIHQTSPYKDELCGFLIVAFIVSAVICFILRLLSRRSGTVEEKPAVRTGTGMFLAYCAIIGISTAGINLFNLYLSGAMPAAVFFPIVNGGSLVLVTIASLILFRERLTVRQWIGMGMGTAAVLLLCM